MGGRPLVGVLVFSEAAILIGFVFPGETAVIVGGVAASRGHVNIVTLIVVVIACGISGDSVGYLVGREWGPRLLDTRLLRNRQKLLQAALGQLNPGGAWPSGRAVHRLPPSGDPRPGRHVLHAVPDLPPRQRGGRDPRGTAYCLLGYFVGHAYTKVEHVSGVASDVLLGLIVVVIVFVYLRRRRRERPQGAEEPARPQAPE